MASITAVAASPASISAGGSATITPTISNPAATLTGTVYDDQGGSAAVTVAIAAETLTYSVNAAQKGQPGFIVLEVVPTTLGTIAVAANGTSFTFTASSTA